MSLAWVLVAAGAAVVYTWGCVRLGREFPMRRRDEWDDDVLEVARVRYAEDNGYGPGWADDTEFIAHGQPVPVYVSYVTDYDEDDAPRLPSADERTSMYAELAPDEGDERAGTRTDQFHAVWNEMPSVDREALVQWDWKNKALRELSEFDQWGREFMAEWRADLEARGAA